MVNIGVAMKRNGVFVGFLLSDDKMDLGFKIRTFRGLGYTKCGEVFTHGKIR